MRMYSFLRNLDVFLKVCCTREQQLGTVGCMYTLHDATRCRMHAQYSLACRVPGRVLLHVFC
jgi:hypothetical protein